MGPLGVTGLVAEGDVVLLAGVSPKKDCINPCCCTDKGGGITGDGEATVLVEGGLKFNKEPGVVAILEARKIRRERVNIWNCKIYLRR